MKPNFFVVAVPLFDNKMAVQAYRLSDRNAHKLFGTANDYQAAGEFLLTHGLKLVERVGVEPFTGNKKLIELSAQDNLLTKLDGTAKGGIVLAIKHLYNIPIKLVGLGEKMDDLLVFDIEEYIYSLFKEFF